MSATAGAALMAKALLQQRRDAGERQPGLEARNAPDRAGEPDDRNDRRCRSPGKSCLKPGLERLEHASAPGRSFAHRRKMARREGIMPVPVNAAVRPRVPPCRAEWRRRAASSAPSGWCRTSPGMMASGARLPRRARDEDAGRRPQFRDGWTGQIRDAAEAGGERLKHLRQRVGAVDQARARRPASASAAARRDPGFKQTLARRHARRGGAASGDWLPRPSAIEGRVHQHPVGAAVAKSDRVRDAIAARSRPPRRAGRGRRSARSPAAPAPACRKATRAGSRSTPTTDSAGARAATEKATVPTPAPRSTARPVASAARAPAAAPRRARRGGPSAAARA